VVTGAGPAGVVCWGETEGGFAFAGSAGADGRSGAVSGRSGRLIGTVFGRGAGFGVCAAVVEAGPSSARFDGWGVVVTAVVGATAGVVDVLTTGGAGDCATSVTFAWSPSLVAASTIVPAATTTKSASTVQRSGRRRQGFAGRRRRIVGVRRQSRSGSYAPPEVGVGSSTG
jgi:hypothetical protein